MRLHSMTLLPFEQNLSSLPKHFLSPYHESEFIPGARDSEMETNHPFPQRAQSLEKQMDKGTTEEKKMHLVNAQAARAGKS